MPYGTITPEMEVLLRQAVAGKYVWDLGAGDGGHARMLLRLGAKHVTLIDKDWHVHHRKPWRCTGTTVDARPYYEVSDTMVAPPDVAWLSWPTNTVLHGLIPILERTPTVIYLGSNTGGTACGSKKLFTHFAGRELTGHIGHMQNSLLLLGAPLPDGVTRRLTYEEVAGGDPAHCYPSTMGALDYAATAELLTTRM